jgi:hypothetical protein
MGAFNLRFNKHLRHPKNVEYDQYKKENKCWIFKRVGLLLLFSGLGYGPAKALINPNNVDLLFWLKMQLFFIYAMGFYFFGYPKLLGKWELHSYTDLIMTK